MLFNLPNFYRNLNREEHQDGGRVRRGDHLPPHRYIRNTSTCETAPVEHLLNTGKRPQTAQKARNSPHTWVGQKKKEKTETKNTDRGLPWWRSGWESACQCRGHGFEPWSGKIPHAAEQLGP